MGIVLKAHIITNFTYKQFCGVAAMVERLMCHEFATSKSAASSSEVSKNLKIGKDHKPQRGSERVSLKGALCDGART